MNDEEKAEINALIDCIENQITMSDITQFKANSKIDALHESIEQLKYLRDSKSFNFAQELPIFLEALPRSISSRMISLAEELSNSVEELLPRLCKEGRALLIYDAIYAEVDAEYDLPDSKLSRVIRKCIDQHGQVPNCTDRDALLCECPQILAAVESAYQNHSTSHPVKQ